MKRIYACLAIVAALLVIAFYSSFRVQQFAEEISEDLDNAMEAIRDEDLTGARQALAEGAELCDRMREGMNHLLRTEDFTELEAALRAADGHLEWNAPEEAFGELRRAQVQVETLTGRLAQARSMALRSFCRSNGSRELSFLMTISGTVSTTS